MSRPSLPLEEVRRRQLTICLTEGEYLLVQQAAVALSRTPGVALRFFGMHGVRRFTKKDPAIVATTLARRREKRGQVADRAPAASRTVHTVHTGGSVGQVKATRKGGR